MGAFLFLAGSGYNLLGSATITVTSEDANFLKANLFDDRPSRPFRFNAAALNDSITADLLSAQNVDFLSIHGHNLDAGIAVEFRSSTDNFAASNTLEATLTKATPTFYTRLSSPVNRRYWRVLFSGTNSAAIALGEVVLGLASTLTRPPRMNLVLRENRRQIRDRTRAGELFVTNWSDFKERALEANFRGTHALLENLKSNLWDGSEHGSDPIVIVPDASRPEVIHGNVREDLELTRVFAHATTTSDLWDYALTVEESGWFKL